MYNNKAAARDKFSDKFSQTINDAIEKAEAQDLALIATEKAGVTSLTKDLSATSSSEDISIARTKNNEWLTNSLSLADNEKQKKYTKLLMRMMSFLLIKL